MVPMPRKRREDLQDQGIRDSEVDPAEYYPEGYHPELLPQWPVDRDLAMPVDQLPEAMQLSFGENWRYRESAKKHLDELAEEE